MEWLTHTLMRSISRFCVQFQVPGSLEKDPRGSCPCWYGPDLISDPPEVLLARPGGEIRHFHPGCVICSLQRERVEPRVPVNPIAASWPLEVIGLDFLSLGRPTDTYQNILVATDLFTRFVWAIPTHDQTPQTTNLSTVDTCNPAFWYYQNPYDTLPPSR